MAKLSVNGLDGLMLSLQEIAELPDDVVEAMLIAEAEVVEQAQRYYGFQMGVKQEVGGGTTLASIGHTKLKYGSEGDRNMYVYPQGTNENGVRNAEVAFINEYGKRKQVARPFIATANEAAATAAVEAAAKIYDEFLKSKNL